MVFSSTIFIFFFLPLVLLIHALLPRAARNTFLLVASLAFYAWGEQLFIAVMLASITLTYFCGLAVEAGRSERSRRWIVAAAVAANLLLLVSFKYANFLANNLSVLLVACGLDAIQLAPVHLPIGISFFTFQAMSYVVDIHRGHVKAQRNFFRLAFYKAFFPQLIAGPIIRYADVADQMARREVTWDDIVAGASRFVTGLAKKMLIANTLALPADKIFAVPFADLSAAAAWFGIICYALQIYFDFSGYSDMAIGLGRLFGFRYLENFNFPYTAKSLTDFWRRWHISLSTWFRDYLYIPLGGNRRSPLRTYVNLGIVFLLCGVWHGASYSFIAWGLFHGAFLIAERAIGKRTAPALLGHVYTLFVLLISWVLFRADTLHEAVAYLRVMFTGGRDLVPVIGLYWNNEVTLALVAGIIGATPALRIVGQKLSAAPVLRAWLCNAALLVCFALCVLKLAATTHNPFIYFRF